MGTSSYNLSVESIGTRSHRFSALWRRFVWPYFLDIRSRFRFSCEAAERSATVPAMSDDLIYTIVRRADWAQAEQTGRYAGSADDRRDGFLHFSSSAQVVESCARHRAGEDDLLLVAVPASALGQALKWEPSRGGALFPHLYAPLDLVHVAWTVPLPLGKDGRHVFPPALQEGRLS